MSKFISQTYHHQQQHNYHQYMKIISCNLSSYINNNHLTYITKSNNVLLSSRKRIVVNQVQVNKNNTISNYKHYHNKDQQQYRLYQYTRCILQSASSSSSSTTTTTKNRISVEKYCQSITHQFEYQLQIWYDDILMYCKSNRYAVYIVLYRLLYCFTSMIHSYIIMIMKENY